MGFCKKYCPTIIVVLAIVIFGAKWKIDNTNNGMIGLLKAMFKYEKHGEYGKSTAEDIVKERGFSFKDTTSIVTGANTGLGLETARVIGKNGGTVVMACRTPSRCEGGKAKIEAEVKAGGGELKCMQLDLGNLASVDKFVETFLASGLDLDYLVNNAGIMALPEYKTTADGFERQWGVNHLGHFRLTTQLLQKLKQHKGRIVNLSSLAHHSFVGSVSDIPLTKAAYDPDIAYGSSKLSNILFTLGLRQRLKGSGVLATSGHPGVIATELGRNNQAMMDMFMSMFDTYTAITGDSPLKTIPQGTATTLCMMTDELPETGTEKLYYSDCVPGKVGANYYDVLATDQKSAEQLWETSEKFVNQYLSKQG